MKRLKKLAIIVGCRFFIAMCLCMFAGVDIMMAEDKPIISEVNSNPHFRSALDAAGIDFADAIMDAIINRMHA